jgi:predicted permease
MFITHLWQDIKFAIRVLAGSPGLVVAAAVSVGCGIGMGTTIFSQLDGFIFRPVPAIQNSPNLVGMRAPTSYPVYEAFRDSSEQFSDAAAYMGPIPLARNDVHPSVRLWGQFVSPNYFQVLGTAAIQGRTFGPDETKRGIQPVAVISDKLWRQQLDSSNQVVGQTLRLNGRPVTIIGVAAPQFQGASPLMSSADIWMPVTVDPTFAPELGNNVLQDKRQNAFAIIGRLRPGIVSSEAEAKLDAMLKQVSEIKGDDASKRGRQVVFVPGGRRLPIRDADLPATLGVPIVLVGLMLWIACSNVGTMLVARAHARRKEIAIRLSLGADRKRLIRQLLTESLLLAMLGGLVGIVIALWLQTWSARAMKDFTPDFVNFEYRLDWRALIFTFLLTLVAGMMFGLAPALQSTRGDLTQALKKGSAWKIGGFRWFGTRNVLVLQQVAGSLMLLLITGFVVLGIQRTTSVDAGFDTNNLYMMSVDPLRDGYSVEATDTWMSRIRERVKRIPGVIDASLSYYAPVGARSAGASARTKSDVDSLQEALRAVQIEKVGLGYFETTGIAILRGRGFIERDGKESHVIINETMAKQTWPNQDPIGRDVVLNDKHYDVVGVARDFNSGGLFAVSQPGAFQLLTSEDYRRPATHGTVLLIRSVGGVDVTSAIRQDLASTDPNLTVFNISNAKYEVDRALYLTRVTMFIYGGMGVFGLILAAVGLAGVTSYAVVQRTKEIGIRSALGATKLDILRLVTREGAVLIIVGSVIGQALAYGVTRALSSWFNPLADMTKTSTKDPVLLFGAPLLLAGLAMIACYLPARRATHIDPCTALREE